MILTIKDTNIYPNIYLIVYFICNMLIGGGYGVMYVTKSKFVHQIG